MQWYASDLCSGTREPLAAEYSSAKFVFISSVTLVLDGWGVGVSIGQSRFICQVWCSACTSSLLWYQRSPSAKVVSSAKFCVVVCKSSLLWYWGCICQSWFYICQVLCKCMQVNSALVVGRGAIGQSRVFSHVFM